MNSSLKKLLKLAKCSSIKLSKAVKRSKKLTRKMSNKRSKITKRSNKRSNKCNKKRSAKTCRKVCKKSRFGAMPNTLSMMGNVIPYDMSIDQVYTGMSPLQAQKHIEDVPASLRASFYTSN